MALDDSYTKVLLHGEGVDAATTFTDESGKLWTAVGAAQIDTAQKKFGNASLYFTATSDYIYTTDHTDFNVGSDDFTIECWVKYESPGLAANVVCSKRGGLATSDDSFLLLFTSDNLPRFTVYNAASTGVNVTGAASDGASSDTWTHMAGVRNGDNIYLYINGVQIGPTAITGALVNNTNDFSIGGANAGASFKGWIDEFRFSKGIARYTTGFTPSGPFAISAGSESTYYNDGFSVY